MEVNIEKLGDNYVNVNSRDKKKREKGREKNNFLSRTALKKRKIDKKMWQRRVIS